MAITQPTTAMELLTTNLMTNLPTFNMLLPRDITPDEYRAATWLLLKGTPKLAECTHDSVMKALIKAATYGMLPGRDCHLLPFKDHGTLKATYVETYKGIIRALDRTGKVAKAFAHPKCAKDHFELDYGADTFSHIPNMVDPGPAEFYYGCIMMKDGTRHVQAVTLDQIEAIRKKAPGHDSGPWATHYDQMARKTALKQVAQYVQLTPEYEEMDEADDARLLTDIPEERVQQNIIDLTGSDGTPDTAAQEEARHAASAEETERRARGDVLQKIRGACEDYNIEQRPFCAWQDASVAHGSLTLGDNGTLLHTDLETLRDIYEHLCLYESESCAVLLGQSPPTPAEAWESEEDLEDAMMESLTPPETHDGPALLPGLDAATARSEESY